MRAKASFTRFTHKNDYYGGVPNIAYDIFEKRRSRHIYRGLGSVLKLGEHGANNRELKSSYLNTKHVRTRVGPCRKL